MLTDSQKANLGGVLLGRVILVDKAGNTRDDNINKFLLSPQKEVEIFRSIKGIRMVHELEAK